MGGYDAVLAKHGIAAAPKANGGAAAARGGAEGDAAAASGLSDGVSAMGSLSLDGEGPGPAGTTAGANAGKGGTGTGKGKGTGSVAYDGELTALRPAALPPVMTETRYRGYNVDVDKMRDRLRRNAEKRGPSTAS
jgi:hypothetical protein